MTVTLVALYLAAIVAANILVGIYGQAAMVAMAFVLIPFDLVARDLLHKKWNDEWLPLRMGLLIAGGSLLTIVLSPGSMRVAVASCVAFTAAAITDTVVYISLERRSLLVKINGSNLCSATVDSILFPLIALGAFSLSLSVAQVGAKFVGGFLWSLALRRFFK